ncbi:regulatory protein RecX [Muriicola marianensis]|uniref:Regulatory protein RecX n=1 Tax=Muriicola marianensis TaxID=1324801 RepID=A0ABQ1R0F8_9FLAO|nr:regulatory protein RecX [Muriicola marianensis]GGD52053.1 recombinase RecX [Muriicola marianensis]
MQKRPSFTVSEATKKMERYCAYQDRCHQEVLGKLREMRMIPEAMDKIMAHLINHGFLNEERFARSFARGKFRIKKWGRVRITRELKKRDISPFIIRLALEELDNSEYSDTLRDLARKRLTQLKGLDPRLQKKKLYDYLLYRGWESSRIYDQLEDLFPPG